MVIALRDGFYGFAFRGIWANIQVVASVFIWVYNNNAGIVCPNPHLAGIVNIYFLDIAAQALVAGIEVGKLIVAGIKRVQPFFCAHPELAFRSNCQFVDVVVGYCVVVELVVQEKFYPVVIFVVFVQSIVCADP